MTNEEETELVRKHADELGEHFDTVQIFVSRNEPTQGGTVNINMGTGNWFARYGQVRTWLVAEDETTRKKRGNESEREE